MKQVWITVLIIIAVSRSVYAQDAASLVKEGRQLSDDKHYTEAIEKFKSALIAEPDNAQANYQVAFAMFSMNKGINGIPYLQRAVKNNTDNKFAAACYSLSGSIYNSANQLPKAIEAYRQALNADSTNQRIYYNLGIALYRDKQYENAEQSFVAAVERDATDAGSFRMYALSTFHQNKRADAILAFCRFLQLEPDTRRSAEAFGNLQNILNGGALKAEPGYKPTVSKTYLNYYDGIVSQALNGLLKQKGLGDVALLQTRLSAVFSKLNATPRDKLYYWHKLADYLGKLEKAGYMPVFTRYISQSVYPESKKWLKDNGEKEKGFMKWMQETAF